MAKKSLSVSMRPLIAGLILFGGFGAGVPSVQANPKATENLQPQAVPPLYREAACDVKTVGRPTEDQVFEYKMLDPDGRPGSSGVRHTIRALSGDRVDYWDEIVMPGMGAFPAERRQAQVVVLPTRLMETDVVYEDAAAVIQALGPGQSANLPFSFVARGSTDAPTPGTAELTFVGCGVSEAVVKGAANEAVRVYRLRISSLPGGPIDTEFLVSPERGWPIAERQRGGVLVLTSASD